MNTVQKYTLRPLDKNNKGSSAHAIFSNSLRVSYDTGVEGVMTFSQCVCVRVS